MMEAVSSGPKRMNKDDDEDDDNSNNNKLSLMDDTLPRPQQQQHLLQETHDAILNSSRLDSLRAGDAAPLLSSYNARSFVMTFRLSGRNSGMLVYPLLALLVWDAFWIILLELSDDDFFNPKDEEEDEGWFWFQRGGGSSSVDLIAPLLLPVSFLLVFRLGRAAVRYWDARAAAGKLVELCRCVISTVLVAIAATAAETSSRTTTTTLLASASLLVLNDIDNNNNKLSILDTNAIFLVDEFAKWLCLFPIVVKNALRRGDDDEGDGVNSKCHYNYYCKSQRQREQQHREREQHRLLEEIGLLFSKKNAAVVLSWSSSTSNNILSSYSSYGPTLVLNRLRLLAHQAATIAATTTATATSSSSTTKEESLFNPTPSLSSSWQPNMLYRQLNSQLDSLTGAWGAMERIDATPLPFVYVVHLRTFLMLYLFLWHFHAIFANHYYSDTTKASSNSGSGGWRVLFLLVPLFGASWGLLGIEAAAVECERPFRKRSPNHLALGQMCITVSQNVAQSMREIILCNLDQRRI